MNEKLVYYFQRSTQYGYDQLRIIAFSQGQADKIIRETVLNPEEWKLHTVEKKPLLN